MQPITSLSVNDAFLRILLQGEPKSGKSTMSAQFPGAYFIDIDVNLAGPVRHLMKNKLTLPVGYDVLDKDEKGVEVPPLLRYQRFSKLMAEAAANPLIQTIIIDSATGFADILMEETKRQQPSIKDGRQLFGFFFIYGKELMTRLKGIRKHIVFICHEKTDKLADGSVVYPIRINWPGQLGPIMGSFFTDVWRCEVAEKPSGFTSTYEWNVRTMPNYQFKLGNSLDLPAVFKFDWNLIQAKLDVLKTLTVA